MTTRVKVAAGARAAEAGDVVNLTPADARRIRAAQARRVDAMRAAELAALRAKVAVGDAIEFELATVREVAERVGFDADVPWDLGSDNVLRRVTPPPGGRG